MKQLFLVLAIVLFFNQSLYLVNATNKLSRDCEILKGIYDSYKIKNFQSNCCDMSNIGCENINSETRMTRLDLSKTNIKEIPNNIVNLKELKIINFSGNGLNGEIPTFFNKLTHLEEINLSKNKFYGQIPKSFLEIKNLTILDISDNRLFGVIPSEFCDLEKLKEIKFNDNMSGVYPSSCVAKKFGFKQNNYVRWARWIISIGTLVVIVIFAFLNLSARQNQIKIKFKKLSQGRFNKYSKDDEGIKNP